ncbi:MAG: FAD-binding oxidoreductase [Minisyncoccota bacterium]
MEDLKKSISVIFQGSLFDDQATRATYENDASIFELRPRLIAQPRNVADVEALVRFVSEHKTEDPTLSITPRAAGTGMAGGALTDSILLDVTKLNRIKEVTDEYAVVEPGVYYRDLEKATLERNRIMPSYPASKGLCAVGGMVGTNASGEKTLNYGSTERYVRKLNVVLADGNEYSFYPLTKEALAEKMRLENFEGEIYRKMYDLLEINYDTIKKAMPRVSKNSTGYALWNVWDRTTFDLTKLFTGSEGTLGITTEITFGLVETKKHTKLLVIFLKDLAPLPQIVEKILAHKPETFESYDDNTFRFAVRFFPDIVRSLVSRGLFILAFRFLPEFFMILKSGFPKLVLLAEFTGDTEEEVGEHARRAQADIASFGFQTKITKTKEDAEKYWTIRHESFNLLRHHGGKKRTAPFIDDIIVAPKHLPVFLPRLTGIMREYNLTYTIAGHIGDGNLHIIPLMDLRKERDRDIVIELSQKVFDLVFEFGGSMSAEHNDGLVRTPFLKRMYGDTIYHLFEETKNIFDPKHILNPGKKVFGGDFSFLKEHIDRVY